MTISDLLVELEDREPWRAQAACRGADLDAFFPSVSAGRGRPRLGIDVTVTAVAEAICRACPVRSDCLDHALEAPEPFGVWGGVSARGRQRIARDRRHVA